MPLWLDAAFAHHLPHGSHGHEVGTANPHDLKVAPVGLGPQRGGGDAASKDGLASLLEGDRVVVGEGRGSLAHPSASSVMRAASMAACQAAVNSGNAEYAASVICRVGTYMAWIVARA